MLTKITVETALNADLDDYLGFERHKQIQKNVASVVALSVSHSVDTDIQIPDIKRAHGSSG